MKLYHLSDLHLGVDPPALGRERHRRLVFEKLSGVIKRAREEGVNFIVLAGDVFDSNALSSALVLSLLELLAVAEEINFILLPGGGRLHGEVSGHDAYTQDSLYRRLEVKSFFDRHPNLRLLTPEAPVAVFPQEGIAFYGGFFDLPRAPLVEGIDYHVAVMHGAFGERKEFGEKSLNTPQVEKYDYLALGHYHAFKKITPRAAYAGAFLQFEFLPRGQGASGYLEIELSPEGEPLISYQAFSDAPLFLYRRVLSPTELASLEAMDFKNTFVRVTEYLSEFREPLKRLKERFPSRISFSEAAEVSAGDLTVLAVLDKILARKVPEEHQEEVKELLLYGLRVSARRREIEQFLRDKYGL